MRIKRGVTARKRHKKLLRSAKGMGHARRSSSRLARQAVTRSLQYAYRDRRNRKRDMRKLWILRVSAAAKESGMSYSAFIAGLKKANIILDRKILSDLAVRTPHVLQALVNQVKKNS